MKLSDGWSVILAVIIAEGHSLRSPNWRGPF